MSGRRLPVELALVLLGFVCVALVYAFTTPIFEASDELRHFAMVEYVREVGGLPVQDPAHEEETPWHQEGSQPPLYYALTAALTRPFSLDGLDALREMNPHAKLGIPGIVDNRNLVLHDDSPTPFEGAALAVYVGRFFSIGLALVSITAIYFTTLALSARPLLALLAAAFVAFNPMFLFISASVNNDNLVTMFNSLIVLLAVRMLLYGFDTRRSLLIAVLIAFGTLSKLSGLVMVPVVAVAALWLAWKTRDLRGLLILGMSMAGIWMLIAGWWYLRNLLYYDELFGTHTMVQIAGPRTGDFTFSTLLDEFEGFRISFWALFGLVNILLPMIFYDLLDLISLLAVIGFVGHLWRSAQQRAVELRTVADDRRLAALVMLAAVLVIGSISLISWTAQTYASQGRLLFPFMGVIAPMFVLGLYELARGLMLRLDIPPRLPAFMVRLAIWGAATLAALIPLVYIAPVYAQPKALETLPETAFPVYARFEHAELISYWSPARRYVPGEQLEVTLYWRTLMQTERDYSLFVHIIDAEGREIGKVDTFPGGGRLRTSRWQSDAIYADTYGIVIDESALSNAQLRLKVGWWYAPDELYLGATDSAGNTLTDVILNAGGLRGADVESLAMQPQGALEFGGQIRLESYDLTDERLSLVWEAVDQPIGDFVVFAQVLDADDQIIAQGDAPPPLPTRYWLPGERFRTDHVLRPVGEAIPPGRYRLLVGWYTPEDFYRLENGQPGSAFELTEIAFP